MLTLDEAILHCEEKAEELKKDYERACAYNIPSEGCLKCAEEHEQLANWLKELKTLRDVHGKVYRNEHCDSAGKCYDYIGYHCAGCNSAKESNR